MRTVIDSVSVSFEIEGKGPSLLLVHGWGGSSASLASLSHILSKSYTVYRIDLPGFGSSQNPPSHWGVFEYASLVSTFITNVVHDKHIIYFGHSFGGSIGIVLTSQKSNQIKYLILCASAFKRSVQTTQAAGRFDRLPQWIKPFAQPIKWWYYRLLYPNSDIRIAPQLEPNFRKIVTEDLTSRLPHITTPTLILWGADDTVTPVSHAETLSQSIPHAQLKILPEHAHNLPLIAPEIVSESILHFIIQNQL